MKFLQKTPSNKSAKLISKQLQQVGSSEDADGLSVKMEVVHSSKGDLEKLNKMMQEGELNKEAVLEILEESEKIKAENEFHKLRLKHLEERLKEEDEERLAA